MCILLGGLVVPTRMDPPQHGPEVQVFPGLESESSEHLNNLVPLENCNVK